MPRFSGSSAKNYRRVKVAPVGSSPSKSPSSLPSLASKSGEDSDSDEEEDNRVRDFSGIPSDSEDSDDKDDQDDKDDKDSDNDRKSNSMATDDEMHSFQSPAKAPASPSSLSSGGSPKIIAVLPQLKETRRREAAAAEILEFQRQLAIKSDEKVKAQEEGKAAAKELLPAPRKLEEGADWKKKTTEKERLMERVRAMQAAAAAAGEAGYIEAALQRTALLGKGGRGAVAEQQEQVIHVYTSDEDSENDDDRAKEQVIHVYTSAEDSENDDSANSKPGTSRNRCFKPSTPSARRTDADDLVAHNLRRARSCMHAVCSDSRSSHAQPSGHTNRSYHLWRKLHTKSFQIINACISTTSIQNR